MKIKEFLNQYPTAKERANAKREFAHSLNVSFSTVRSWSNGNRHPKRSLWRKIEAATNGKIKASDLFD